MTSSGRIVAGLVRAGLLVVLLGAACAGNTDQPGGDGTSSVPETGATIESSPETTSPSTVSALKRHDVVPGGLQDMLRFIAPISGLCRLLIAPTATAPPFPLPVEVAHTYRVCFSGFDPEQESIHISVLGPDGEETRSEDILASQGNGNWFLSASPDDPLGPYTFVATQPPPEGQTEPLAASGAFTVVMADDPAVASMIGSGPPGTTFRFALAGFEPGSTVPLYLYEDRPAEDPVFQTSLPSASIDEEGEATYDLPTAADDPPGAYVIATDSAAGRGLCIDDVSCVTIQVTA